jgi:catechol 2,3-dioxygenase-like lactoylglutathione lyase family enzyme
MVSSATCVRDTALAIKILSLTNVNMCGILFTLIIANVSEESMSRVQLALNVSNLEEAIDFYSKLFNAQPAKLRPGYANFAIVDPPLKLVLMENPAARDHGVGGAMNHLGVEVETIQEVTDATSRLSGEGLKTEIEEQTNCCFAIQNKVWVSDPDGAPWEVYTVLADAPADSTLNGDAACCLPDVVQELLVSAGSSTPSTTACC